MKLHQITEGKVPTGTYACVHFDDATLEHISNLMDELDVPNRVPLSEIHTTLLYSRKYLPDYEAQRKYDKPMTGRTTELQTWTGRDSDSTNNILVLLFDSEQLQKRHKKLMKDHDATYDFPEYLPHITLSYDADKDMDKLHYDNFDVAIIGENKSDLSD